MGAIRLLRWSDVDLTVARIRWRAENDKIGFEHLTSLTPLAVQALEAARARSAGIGNAWIFPGVESPDRPLSRHTLTRWWRALETKARVPHVVRCGWHSLRRKFATEMKHAPLRDLAYLGGWKSAATVVNVYQQPDDATMKSASATRRPLIASS